MKESEERLSKAMEKFRDSDPVDEDDIPEHLVAYFKGRFWRAKQVADTPLELHAESYGVKSASIILIDRGQITTIPINKLYATTGMEWLRKPAPFCFKCHIADVIPVAEDGKWCDEATSCFERFTWRRDDLKMIQRGPIDPVQASMPVELLFPESFTDDPFSPAITVETSMSRKLMYEDLAQPKPLEDDEFFNAIEEVATSSTLDDTLTLPEEIQPIVSRWLPPHMIMMDDQESAMLRITSVDGAFQIYGHEVKDKYKIRSMKHYFDSIYDYLVDRPEDSKEVWGVGEACVAKLAGGGWYRAQVEFQYQNSGMVRVLYVDLGRVQEVNYTDLRIPRAYGNKVCTTIPEFQRV